MIDPTLSLDEAYDQTFTYEELYEIPLEVIANSFHTEYAGCGSHQMSLKLELSLDEAQDLYDRLVELKGIKLKPAAG